MTDENDDKHAPRWAAATQEVRAGMQRTDIGEHSEPIFMTSSFVFDSAEQAAARFDQSEPGNVYSRYTNPTVQAFERRLAILEGGEHCVATASGMAAILATAMSLLKAGDHILVSRAVFGSTISLCDKYLSPFGIEVTYVDAGDDWAAACRKNTRLFFVETPSNPLMGLCDISALADIAHAHDCLLAVDNCFCTPALQKPLALGADLVIHSATKYIDGQGRGLGGAVIANEEIGKLVHGFIRTAGPSISPFNAWIFLKALETLSLRMQAHSASAMKLAEFLEAHRAVARVFYPGLASHPQHELASRQQSDYGGVVSFEAVGGRQGAWQVVDATRMISITSNLGDTRSTITHPATTTHARLSPEAREAAGITEGLLRISVGLEDVDDICTDLARGLDQLAL